MIKKYYGSLSKEARLSFWVVVSNITQKGIGILATPIFTRILTTEEYAQSTLYDAWFAIFMVFASLQIYDYATMTGMTKYKNDHKQFIASAQMTMIMVTSLFGMVLFPVSVCTKVIDFPISIIALMFVDIITYSAYNLWSTEQQCLFGYKKLAIVSIGMGALSFIFQLLFVLFLENKAYARIHGLVFIHMVIGSVLLCINIKNINIVGFKKYLKYFVRFSLPLIPHLLASQILMRADRLMISSFCGDGYASLYSLAYSLAMLTILINDAILKAYIPWEYERIKERNTKDVSGITNILVIAVAFANSIVVLMAPELVRIFAPEEYYSAIYVIPPVSASVFFMFLFNLYVNIEYYFEKTRFISVASIGAAMLNVILNYLFIPKFGFVAAGYTTLISYVFFTIGHYIFSKKIVRSEISEGVIYGDRFILITSIIFVTTMIVISRSYDLIAIRYVLMVVVFVILFTQKQRIFKIIELLKEN